MKKYARWLIVGCLAMVMSIFAAVSVPAWASMKHDSRELEFGQEYTGQWARWNFYDDTSNDGEDYYSFTLSKKSFVHISYYNDSSRTDDSPLVFDINENEVIHATDEIFHEESYMEEYNLNLKGYTISRVLDKGTYYLKIPRWSDKFESKTYNYVFYVTKEDPIRLERVKVKSLKSNKARQIEVFLPELGEDAECFEIECSVKSDFSVPISTTSIDSSAVLKQLSGGKKYYVRIRQIGYYGTGDKVDGAWSPVKSITVKK